MCRLQSGAIDSITDQLGAYVEILDAAFTKTKVKAGSQVWLQASAFELYALLKAAVEGQGALEPRLAELTQALAAQVYPGEANNLLSFTSIVVSIHRLVRPRHVSRCLSRGAAPSLAFWLLKHRPSPAPAQAPRFTSPRA